MTRAEIREFFTRHLQAIIVAANHLANKKGSAKRLTETLNTLDDHFRAIQRYRSSDLDPSDLDD